MGDKVQAAVLEMENECAILQGSTAIWPIQGDYSILPFPLYSSFIQEVRQLPFHGHIRPKGCLSVPH